MAHVWSPGAAACRLYPQPTASRYRNASPVATAQEIIHCFGVNTARRQMAPLPRMSDDEADSGQEICLPETASLVT
jgi:hypothetical protein